MATGNVLSPEDSVTRSGIAGDASEEVDSLIKMLRRERGQENFDLVLRGTLARVDALVSVVMSVLGGDDGRETAEMREVVYGVEQ